MTSDVGADNDAVGGDGGSLMVGRETLTLRQKATDILRQAIIDQRFPPGKHLVERELCELLGVSRTSVREALRHLESESLIRMVPHKGPVVASLTAKEARSIYEVRAALEGLAGELFAKRASDQQVARLRKIVEEMLKAAKKNDPAKILEIKSQFYEVLFAGAQSDVCAQMIQSLNTRVWLLRRMSLGSPSRMDSIAPEMQRISDAAETRDASEMRAACVAHVESAYQAVLPQLTESEEKQTDEAAR